MPFGMRFQHAAGCLDRHMLADAGEDILQRAALGRVIEHVVGGKQGNAGGTRYLLPLAQAALVVAAIRHISAEPNPLGCDIRQTLQKSANVFRSSPKIVRKFYRRLFFQSCVLSPPPSRCARHLPRKRRRKICCCALSFLPRMRGRWPGGPEGGLPIQFS